MLSDKNDGYCALIGSVGYDFYGNLYAQLLEEEKIIPLFEKFENINTGVCGVFCHKRDRGHLTDLGASTLISMEFVQRIWKELVDVQLVYTELFILKHRKNIVYLLAELGLKDGKIFGFNIPSFYFIENFLDDIQNLFEYADVVFANKAEAEFFVKFLNIEVFIIILII
jgi:sugar/nucleoside kinase (ribokinase family)